MFKFKYIWFFFAFVILNNIFLISNSFAQSRGDSVMNAPTLGATPTLHYQGTSASSGNIYSYTAVTQYQTAMCPSGLTVSATGSTIYNSAQRIITTTYLGTQIVGTNTGSWTDIDTDCTGIQTQVIACPAGYTGTITQQQKVATSSGGNGTLQYGGWVTTANNCVAPSVNVVFVSGYMNNYMNGYDNGSATVNLGPAGYLASSSGNYAVYGFYSLYENGVYFQAFRTNTPNLTGKTLTITYGGNSYSAVLGGAAQQDTIAPSLCPDSGCFPNPPSNEYVYQIRSYALTVVAFAPPGSAFGLTVN